jgi:hypothetical protein
LGPSESIYLSPEAVPSDGPARVLIGSYGNAASSIQAPSPMNYRELSAKVRKAQMRVVQPGVLSGGLTLRKSLSYL